MVYSVRVPLSSPLPLAIIAIAVNLFAVFVQFYIILHPEQNYTYVGVDHPRELLAEVPRVNMQFHDDPKYYAMNGLNSSMEWKSLQPFGDGIVFMGEDFAAYDVSMWHQLRCLNYIRKTLVGEADDYAHTEHCFHYLRQAILCSADLTLEPLPSDSPQVDGNEHPAPSDNVVHTCKDWRQIYDLTEELYASKP